MKQTLTLVTLAVADLARSLAFYRDGLGWSPAFATDEAAFFQMNGLVFGLFRHDEFAKDFGGKVTLGAKSTALAHNVSSRDDVRRVLDEVRQIEGGTILREATDRAWGGCSGYFEDPDGHLWEVAWNPQWTISPEGFVRL